MKSNLALLDRAVEGAIAHELGDGKHDESALAELGVQPQRFRTVAGLKVVTNAARDAEVDPNAAQLNDKLLRYRAEKSLVQQKLERVGITPLAVLPLSAWDRICDRTKLYRFTPQGNVVRNDSKKFMDEVSRLVEEKAYPVRAGKAKTWMRGMAITWAIALVGITAVIIAKVPELSWATFLLWPYVVITIGAFVIWGFRRMSIAEYPSIDEKKRLEAECIRELAEKHTKAGTLPELFWPNYREPPKGNNTGTVALTLPEPPPEVQAKLIALEKARLPLNIAVVREAIGVSAKWADVLIEARENFYESLKLDPIIYVVEGSAVAVIDQYGDFPIEKEVVNEVINSVHLA